MLREEEFGKFDIKVVEALCNLIGQLSIRQQSRTDEWKYRSCDICSARLQLRPMIRMDEDGSVLDLTTNRNLAIERVLT